MRTLGAVYHVYKNKIASDFVLKNYRKNFPTSPIVLISDGGDDFSDLAKKYNCNYIWRENLYINKDPFNSVLLVEWMHRQKYCCDYCSTNYMLILEDDVFVQKPIDIDFDFDMCGVYGYNFFLDAVGQEIAQKTKDNNTLFTYGLCGGGIYNVEIFLKLYDDIVKDIVDNHDKMLSIKNDKGFSDYHQTGATDALLVYHFLKRGYKYIKSPWLKEVYREGYDENTPIIHQYKVYY